MRAVAMLFAVAVASGCADDKAPPMSMSPPVPAVPGCQPPAGVSGAPTSVGEMVTLVNALPRPLTLVCLLESLQRPLHVSAVLSRISLQPATGTRSPRLFLSSGKLVSSISIEGKGSELMEFGEFVDETRTIKAEIAFPVMGTVEPADPYRRISDARGTSCRFCHAFEEPALELVPFAPAYISSALRPSWPSLMELSDVRKEHQECDPSAEPQRCALLRALFEHGEVRSWTFPESVPTLGH